jgi:lipoprotein-releasing system permease protein
MLNTENIAVFDLTLVIVVFNLIGALIMMILDKKRNLKNTFNLGTKSKDLRKYFYFKERYQVSFGELSDV